LLVATSLADGTVDYRAPAYPAPTFILIGNEARGLPAAYEAAADVRVQMPMRGRADSLNASVAAAVMAYQVLDWQDRQRR
jgi:TrmH family RNA methyltransferase